MDLVSGLRFVLALVVVIGLIAGLAWLLRKYGAGRITMGANKGRLAVVEATHIDAKRRLVLIRRDGTEHLILLSPNSETVIETNIEADIRSSIRKIYYALSGNDPVRDRWLSHTQDQRLLDPFPDPNPFLPGWVKMTSTIWSRTLKQVGFVAPSTVTETPVGIMTTCRK